MMGIVLCLAMGLGGQTMKALEFKNQEIRDILFVLAELNSVSIIPDDTVSGRASFIFSNMEFEAALRLFLDSNKLYAINRGGVYYISRVWIDYQQDSGRISVKGTDVPLKALITAVAGAAGKTILYDALPQEYLTVQADSVSLRDFLGIAMAKYPDFSIDSTATYFYIRKKGSSTAVDSRPAKGYFSLEGDRFSIDLDRAKFRDLVLELFERTNREVVFLMDQNAVLENLSYSGKSFEAMLKLLLLRVGADFSVSDGVYFIVEAQKRDLQNKLLTTLVIPLQHISFQDFQRLLPSALNSSGKIRVDEKDNRVLLNGTMEELRPVLEFISIVDSEKTNESTIRVDLSFLRADEAIALLPGEFAAFGPVALPSKTGFVISVPPAKAQRLKDAVALVDRQDQGVPIQLKYLKAEELLANLPPSVTDQNVRKSPNSSLVFFKGSESQRRNFLKDLAVLDRPRPQIKYQILVLEVEDSDNLTWRLDAKATPLGSGASPGINFLKGSIGGLLGLGFDVVSTFGVKFSFDINWQLTTQKAKVVADTTLQAISGEKISFRNTRTIRIPVTTTTGSTGTATSTTDFREVTSGLIFNIEGSASGARMVTLRIDSTLSKNLGGNSEDKSVATTTEKVLSTTVRTEVGQPVAVTGLKQETVIETLHKVPFLGDVPILGWLFKSTTRDPIQTQYIIYIIPRIEEPELNRDQVERGLVERYYQYLFSQDAQAVR